MPTSPERYETLTIEPPCPKRLIGRIFGKDGKAGSYYVPR
jgi:hypothetical protein